MNGDGFGDNHGSAAFSSYRLLTDWEAPAPGFFVIPPVESYRLGDVNKDGLDDIEIVNALHNVSGQPLVLLSSADLDSLDRDDGQVDKVIDINQIHRGPSSWRFINAQPGFDGIKLSSGNVGDLNGDGILDIGISNPSSYGGSGAITLVYGGGWSVLDEADGQIDGEIDLHACIESKACTRVRSEETSHAIGLVSTPIANLFEENQVSIVLGSASGQSRQLGREGIGSAFVLSHSAIAETVSENSDGNVLIDDIEQHDQTYTFFLEFDGFLEAFMFGGRLPDLDQDSVDELLLLTPFSTTTRIYVVASSELEGMDTADFTVDGKINLAASYRFDNSFRIDGFELFQNNIFRSTVQESINREQRSYFLPLLELGDSQASHLVDLRHLANHDAADDETNGVVTTFDLSANQAWSFPEVGYLSVCKPDESMNRAQVVASLVRLAEPFSPSNPLELVVFTTDQLTSLDGIDGAEDGSIELETILAQETPQEVWHVTFGQLTANVGGAYVGCAGDFDGDGHEDIAVTLTHLDGQQIRGADHFARVFRPYGDRSVRRRGGLPSQC